MWDLVWAVNRAENCRILSRAVCSFLHRRSRGSTRSTKVARVLCCVGLRFHIDETHPNGFQWHVGTICNFVTIWGISGWYKSHTSAPLERTAVSCWQKTIESVKLATSTKGIQLEVKCVLEVSERMMDGECVGGGVVWYNETCFPCSRVIVIITRKIIIIIIIIMGKVSRCL